MIVWLSMLAALFAGSMLPLQAGVNAQLARAGGNALWASGISFLVGTLTLLMVYSSLRLTWPSFDELKEAPLWAWSGGLMGAFFVTCMAFFAPRLGATTLLALVISGQILASLLLDHFGAVGFNVHEINLWRILGVILIGTGVLLVRKF